MSLIWIPNAISCMRIVLVAPILLLILNNSFGWALALFCLAGFSDGIDGYLAKRYNWHTRLGALLDPLADKLLVAGTFITLAYTQDIPLWLAAAVILRDVIIVAGAAAYNFLVKPVQGEPTRISKLNTTLQLLFLVFVLGRAGFGWPEEISITVLGAAVLATVVISGVDYVLSWSRRARRGE
ncbi:MAG: CDP-alcohol phosphatidyltransferase family protein [Gammaproteobacteria bacterium]|nr:CDP-alcohol phosphatidyltransferase family protein [Gammaproteobacteria bacterium]